MEYGKGGRIIKNNDPGINRETLEEEGISLKGLLGDAFAYEWEIADGVVLVLVLMAVKEEG